jgi:hypothetical protein
MFKKKKIKMTKKQLQLNKDLINNMINKIDNISNYCKDPILIIKLAKFQQQLFKIRKKGAEEVIVTEIDYKINDVIDDILKIVATQKDSDELEAMLGKSLSNLIDLMETRITLDYLNY